MKTNKIYRVLLDKSMDSMLSAIEIYNKPNFNYREETFAVLAINAWELLLKAYIYLGKIGTIFVRFIFLSLIQKKMEQNLIHEKFRN